MMKVQMIVTESGEVINFDNVISIEIAEELKRDHETTEFVLYAHTVVDRAKTIRKFDDKETAQTCLMSELKRAKQTDGIARFDGDIMAHETQSVKEHKSRWVVRKPMTEGGEYEVQCEKCGHATGLLLGAKSYEEALERFKEWLECDEGITFTRHCSSCGARMEGIK